MDKTIVISTHDIDFAYEWQIDLLYLIMEILLLMVTMQFLKKNDIIEKSEFKETYTLADNGGNGL